jgi:hypothetical protein
MGMTLTQAVSRVTARLNKNANDTTVATRIKNHINDACQEKWHAYAWSFRYRDYPLVLTPQVTSGTMTATNGSTSITASGTPFLSAHVGAWIQFTGDTTEAWYRVRTVSTSSTAIIEPAYQGTTGSGKAYELSQTDYLLPTELSDTASILVSYGRVSIRPEHQTQTDIGDYPPTAVGGPVRATILRQEQVQATYTTGTVSGSANSATLTGVGTAWLANVKEGDAITLNGDTTIYTVYKVDSDTQITLYNLLVGAVSGVTYSVSRQFGKILRLLPVADRAHVAFVKGLRNYAPLVNNSDTNELLHRYPSAVIESVVWREASSSPDPREDSLYQKSEMMWARAQGEDEALFPAHNYNPIFNPRSRFSF